MNFSFFTCNIVVFEPIISNSTLWRVVYLFYPIICYKLSHVDFSNFTGVTEWSMDFSFFTCHEEYEPIISNSTLWRVEYLFHSIHYLPPNLTNYIYVQVWSFETFDFEFGWVTQIKTYIHPGTQHSIY